MILTFHNQSTHTGSPADMCMNCAFYDTNMKFGTNVEHIITKIFRYRAISDFALVAIFQDGFRNPIFSYLNNYFK